MRLGLNGLVTIKIANKKRVKKEKKGKKRKKKEKKGKKLKLFFLLK